METSSMNSVFRLYRDAFRRHPVTYGASFVITLGVYVYLLSKFGFINVRSLSKPTITVQFEATESYNFGSDKLSLKRVRLVANSNEPIEKITATIEAPKFISEVKLLSRPTVSANLSEFESPQGRKRYEILYRSAESKQELTIILVGKQISSEAATQSPSNDTAVVAEVVAATKSGRLFGASAIGQFSLQDSEQAHSGVEVTPKESTHSQ